MKAALTTLGCKVNHYETEAMRELFLADGWSRLSIFPRRRMSTWSTPAR